jgi:hypothetical protein
MTYTSRSISAALKTIILIAFSILIVGCGSGGGDGDNAQIPNEDSSIELTGSVVKGVVENGIVQAYLIEEQSGVMVSSTNPLGAGVRTDANGRYKLKLPGNTKSSQVMVIMTADSQTTMTCDVVAGCSTSDSVSTIAFGEKINLSDDFNLRNVMEASQGKRENFVHITPFTHLAISRAEAEPEGLTAENINTGKRYVETLFGLDTDALELAIPDITKLDQYTSISKTELETAIMSASFLALVNSPDWDGIDEVLEHAAQRMSSSGSLSSTNMGTLPDVALDDIFYQAGEIVQGLLSDTNNTTQTTLLSNIAEEVQQEYEELSNTPETIDPVLITTQPSSLSVDEHNSALFSIQAIGGGELDYQWRKNGVAITGANNINYQILDASANQAGIYDVIVSNSVGSVISISALLTVNVEVNLTNTNPVAVNDLAVTEEDFSVTINVLENDSDSDGDSLSITGVTSSQGSALINTDYSITFIPNSNFNGTGSITYSLSDGQGGLSTATVSINVSPVNDSPVGTNDAVITQEDTPVSINVLANDTDIDGNNLEILSASAINGSVSITSLNTLTFTPTTNFNGSGLITYTIHDGQGASAEARVAVTVNAVNDSPVGHNDAVSTLEDTPVSIDVLANDTDIDGDSLNILDASAINGSVSISDQNILTFTPTTNFIGTGLITYSIDDGESGSAEATVIVTVNAVNDSPIGNDDFASTLEDTPVSVDVLANDTDINGDTLDIQDVAATNGSVSIGELNILTFTPAANFSGTGFINYSVSDGQGASAKATVTVTISAVNDEPLANNDSAETVEDTSVTLNVLANDSDDDGDNLTVTSATVNTGTVISNLENTLTFTPVANFNGTATITYTITDGQGGLASATVIVNVTAANDEPIAENDIASTDQNTAVSINALSNDFDVDGDNLTISTATATYGNLVLETSGVITYTPLQNFSGSDTITYTIDDSQGGVSTATVSVTVNAVTVLASIDLSWDIPVERENGDALELYEIDGYMIAYGNSNSNLDSEVFVSGALVGNYLLENLSAGNYYFAIATIDSDGVQGAYSSTVIITVI